jgi:TolB-like protein/Tfp pilus assembly protein PilF
MQTTGTIPLAVFPFEDLSSRKELGIFCRSFSADLITGLSRFRQFRVFKFSNDVSPEQILTTLKVGYFVQGEFRCQNEIVHLNVQLCNTETNHLVWANKFEGKLKDLNKIQDNLLKSIVAVLQQQIDQDLLSEIRKNPKVAFSAYSHWLYGMEELKKGSVGADLKAREHFEKALKIQPDYALACTGMSLSYFNEWTCQLWDRWEVNKSGAFEWAQKAIEQDDQNHIITMVLGRIFLYEGSYDTAEYYFRKSLMLNANDPDTLMAIALYIVYLGLGKEALELFERGLTLNPFNAGYPLRLGGFIYFELGQYEKAASFIKHQPNGTANIADTDAYCAAIYYHLGQYDQMHTYWKSYLDTYRRLITKGKDFDHQDAIDWIFKLNPHRHVSHLEEFLKFISKGSFQHAPVKKLPPKEEGVKENCFVKESGVWKFSFDGSVAQTPEVKGFYDLQKLLTQPGQVFHCAELMGSTLEDKGAKIIDEIARREYQKKILEIQGEIEEAELKSDYETLKTLHQEYDHMIEHLSQSLGLKGRIRETGSTVEKARSAVTWRIRNAIARIEQHHPFLGAHFSNAIKTGILCSYKPDREINWVTS